MSNKMQRYTVYFIWKLLYIFRVVSPPIIRSENNLYLQHLVFATPLLLPAAIAAGSSNKIQLFALLMMGGGTTRNM